MHNFYNVACASRRTLDHAKQPFNQLLRRKYDQKAAHVPLS